MANFLSKIWGALKAAADALEAREHARDRELDKEWTRFHREAARDSELRIIQVSRVYQQARTGTKAIVVHRSKDAAQDAWFGGPSQDAWFHDRRVSRGSILLVRGSSAWGAHNRNPNVLYIHPPHVIGQLPPVTESAVTRHRARMKRTPRHRP